jgi:hypothetical protein
LSMTYDPDITAPYDVSDVSYIIWKCKENVFLCELLQTITRYVTMFCLK